MFIMDVRRKVQPGNHGSPMIFNRFQYPIVFILHLEKLTSSALRSDSCTRMHVYVYSPYTPTKPRRLTKPNHQSTWAGESQNIIFAIFAMFAPCSLTHCQPRHIEATCSSGGLWFWAQDSSQTLSFLPHVTHGLFVRI